MRRLGAACFLILVLAVASCSQLLAEGGRAPLDRRGEQNARTGSCESAPSGEPCLQTDGQCEPSCAHGEAQRAVAFHCRVETYTSNGLVLSDGSCVGQSGGTLEEQRSSCEAAFAPPPSDQAVAYTVNCTEVQTLGSIRERDLLTRSGNGQSRQPSPSGSK